MIRNQDGLHAEFGATTGRYPRTMNEAYGRYQRLHVEEDWDLGESLSVWNCLGIFAACLLVAYAIVG